MLTEGASTEVTRTLASTNQSTVYSGDGLVRDHECVLDEVDMLLTFICQRAGRRTAKLNTHRGRYGWYFLFNFFFFNAVSFIVRTGDKGHGYPILSYPILSPTNKTKQLPFLDFDHPPPFSPMRPTILCIYLHASYTAHACEKLRPTTAVVCTGL